MGTTGNTEILLRTIVPGEFAAVEALIRDSFGVRTGAGPGKDFPTAMHPSNHDHIYVGEISGQLVCAATVLIRLWHTSVGPRLTACLGSFATPTAWRGRGYSAALQQYILGDLNDSGVDWALLWTDRPEVYRGRGFAALGYEQHGRIDGCHWPQSDPGGFVRRADPLDAPQLLELYEGHDLRAQRTQTDMLAYIDPTVSQTFVVERGGRVLAYASLGKGRDFAGYVHEYAGPVDLVHMLWGKAVEHGAQFVLVPQGAERYMADTAIPTRIQAGALAKVLRHERFPTPIDDLRWAAWGFDSA